MRDVVIVSGARTAVGSFGGGLKDVRAVDLGALVIREALRRACLRPDLSADRPRLPSRYLQGRGKNRASKEI